MQITYGIRATTLITIFIYLFFIPLHTSVASTIEEQEKALKIIADFADRFCKDVPLQGEGDNLELTGKAQAELNGIIKKIAKLGGEGAIKYQKQEYMGLLQKDLVKALQSSMGCRMQVWKDLKEKLLPSAVDTGTTKQINKPESYSHLILNDKTYFNKQVYASSPLPEEIINEIDRQPVLQQSKVQDSYRNLKVRWNVTFQAISTRGSADINESNLIHLMTFDRGNYPWVVFWADMNKEPMIKNLRRGDKLQVYGEIERVYSNEIYLRKVKLFNGWAK